MFGIDADVSDAGGLVRSRVRHKMMGFDARMCLFCLGSREGILVILLGLAFHFGA